MSMDSWPAGSALGDGTALPLASSRASAERTEGNEGGWLHTAARVTGAARTPCGCGRAAAALIWPLIWEAAYAAARGQPAQSTPAKGTPVTPRLLILQQLPHRVASHPESWWKMQTPRSRAAGWEGQGQTLTMTFSHCQALS